MRIVSIVASESGYETTVCVMQYDRNCDVKPRDLNWCDVIVMSSHGPELM